MVTSVTFSLVYIIESNPVSIFQFSGDHIFWSEPNSVEEKSEPSPHREAKRQIGLMSQVKVSFAINDIVIDILLTFKVTLTYFHTFLTISDSVNSDLNIKLCILSRPRKKHFL